MKTPLTFGLAAAACLLAAASPVIGAQFLAYEGPDSVHEGHGGEKKVVGGVDFWLHGSPPRRFQVIGSVVDERRQRGIIGAIEMSMLDDDVAREARSAGGNAVILTEEHDVARGGVEYSPPDDGRWRRAPGLASKYLVIRYLPDTPAGATPPS
jgi:hypothetical protein